MCLRRGWTTTSAVLVIVSIIMITTFAVIEPSPLLEIVIVIVVVVIVVEPSSAMIAPVIPAVVAAVLSILAILCILLETSIVLMRSSDRHGWRRGWRVALVGGWRVGRGRLVRIVRLWWIDGAHWSDDITRRSVIKTHSDRRAHRLGLWLIVVSTSTSSGAKVLGRRLMLRGVRRRGRTPLLWRTTWLLL